MAEPENTGADYSAFWAERDAHQTAVKDKLAEALALIRNNDIKASLYRDGITTKLNDAALSLEHHITQLGTPQGQQTLPVFAPPPAN